MNRSHEFTDSTPTQLRQAAADQNPYASPRSGSPLLIPAATAIGIWQFGDKLVMHQDAVMPPVCFRSGLPCDSSEARTYSGSSPVVNWTTRITFITIAAMSAIALLLFEDPPLSYWEAAGALFAGLFLAWLTAPIGAKEIRITYYHSRYSRQRRLRWRIVGIAATTFGIVLIPFCSVYQPTWLPDYAPIFPLLLIVGGGSIFLPASIEFGAKHFQGSYVLLGGCGKAFISSFPECTLEFRQTPGVWIRRMVQSME